MSRTPSLSELFRGALAQQAGQIRVALPGRVVRYDATRQLADVQPCLKGTYEDEDGERVSERLPVVPAVPVVFPGAGGFRVTFPVAVGDTVLLVFSDASIDKWLAYGGEVDPADERTHHLTDAVAIPGLRDFAHSLKSPDADAATIGIEGGTFEGAALGETLDGYLDALKVWADAHTHGGSAPNPSPTVPDVVSETVKVSR